MAKPAGYEPVPGSERPNVPESTLVGPVQGSEKIAFTVLLHQRPNSPNLHDFEHWRNTPPNQRTFLSSEDFMRTYGAADEDLRALVDFLESRELRVIEADAGRRRVVVEGTATHVNEAFHLVLHRYRTNFQFPRRPTRVNDHTVQAKIEPRREHRGFDGPVYVPSNLIHVVRAVIGLDNRRVGGPAGAGTGDPPGAGFLDPTQVAQLYNFPTSGASGQTIGLFAAADEGSAYLPADISEFITSLPPGYNTPPNVTPIGLTVGATVYGNNTALITGGSASGAAYETTQDIETSAAIGQGANINVYFTQNSEAGWEAFFSRAIFPQPGDNPPSVLSASWVLYLDDAQTPNAAAGSPGIGNPSASGSLSNILSGYLQTAAMRGISALIAIGDWGAANQVVDSECHVSYPNSDPWFTGCGGTIIGAVTSVAPPGFEEYAWSDANTASQFNGSPYDATGGGVSDTFPIPPYQTAAGILPISKVDGNSRRGVPDVAGMVAMEGFVLNGGGYTFLGTSCVAPLYAGLVATINAFLGHSVGFLNPTLYRYGPEICKDVTVGNNDSGYAPDSPFYTTDIGWDPCTGWGSIDGLRFLAALAPGAIIATAITTAGDFGTVCVGSFTDEPLTINNAGFSDLLITGISIAPATEFSAPAVASYPLVVSPGASIDLPIRFKPTSSGLASATVTISSNSIFGAATLEVTGIGGAPRLALAIADQGNFGHICRGSFADEPLLLSNSGTCPLSITNIASDSPEFVVPQVVSFPLVIAPGGFLPLPIRFEPSAAGAASATITVTSNNPAGPLSVSVAGDAPSGKLAVSGSTSFGGVQAGCCADRTVFICNVGKCALDVTSVAFKRKSRQWKLLNSPFPTTVPPGTCLPLVLQYHALDKCSRPCELVIESDDPATPVKSVEVLAYTVGGDCGCGDDQRKPQCCRQGYECCGDDGDDC
ncbi:MAG: choice-of-anchor D domain-containing protein [Candidatus Velthaea sp.]